MTKMVNLAQDVIDLVCGVGSYKPQVPFVKSTQIPTHIISKLILTDKGMHSFVTSKNTL